MSSAPPPVRRALPLMLVMAFASGVTSAERTRSAPEDAVYENPVDVHVTEPRLSPRPEPLRDLAVEQVLDVTDFGATPDDEGNDLEAIRRALKQAMAAKAPTEVRFPKGRYYLDADIDTDEQAKMTSHALAMLRAENVILNGNGSEVIIRTPPTGFLSLYACKNVIVRDFVVDWDPPPFAQGFVRGVNRQEGWFAFEVEPGYISMDHPLWQRPNRKGYASIRWGMLKDPEIPGRMKRDVPNVYFSDEWEKVGERTFRMRLRNPRLIQYFEVGDRYVHVDRNGGSLILCPNCERVTFQRITNYTSPGLDYGGGAAKEIAVLDCQVLVKPGRWHTSNADGLHFPVSRPAPWIEGCTFEGMADDGANFYSKGAFCTEVVSDTEFVLTRHAPMEVGARVLVFDPQPGLKLGEARVEAVAVGRGSQRVRLDRAIPGVRTGSEKADPQFFNIDSAGGFVFRNNTFRNIRRFGILIDSRDGLIEGNRFEGTSFNGVVVHNDPDWPEGFATGNVIIRGNTFDTCNLERIGRPEMCASISIKTNRLGFRPAPYRGIADVLVEDNTFLNWRNQAISVGCAENAIVRDNRLVAGADAPARADGEPHVPIRIFNATRVSVRGNRIEDGREVIPRVIEVADDCGEVDVRENSFSRTP
ncbi:MAG: right-handed parallel beta-helix repeat-containing protein [Armatimonadota bacterium]